MDPSYDGHFCTGIIPTGLHVLLRLRTRGCHLLRRWNNSHRFGQSPSKLYRDNGDNNLLAHHTPLIPGNNHKPAVPRKPIVFLSLDNSRLHNHLSTSTHSMPRCHRDRSHGGREIFLDTIRYPSIQKEIEALYSFHSYETQWGDRGRRRRDLVRAEPLDHRIAKLWA